MKKFSWLLLLFLRLAVAEAQTGQSMENLLELSLEELMNIPVTTATKTSGKIDAAPSVMDVITSDQIKQRGYQTLGQVLNDIANNHQDRTNWGIGEPTNQNVGFGFRFDTGQNILILFNGQRLNAFLPGNRFGGEEYLLQSIDRIEIIRGPGSALYGTGAFTAVVNIISKKIASEDAEMLEASSEYIPTSRGYSVSATAGTRVGENRSLIASVRHFSEQGQNLMIRNSLFADQVVKDAVDFATDGEIMFSQNSFNFYSKFSRQQRNTVTGFNSVSPSNQDELKLSMYAYSAGFDKTFKTGKNSTLKVSSGWHQDNWTEVALIPQFKVNDTGSALLLDDEGLPILDTLTLYRNGAMIRTPFFIDGQGGDTQSLDAEIQYTLNYRKGNYFVLGAYFADDRVLNAVRPSELNLDPLEFVPFRNITDPTNNWLFDVQASRQTFAPFAQIDYSISDALTFNAGLRLDRYSGSGALRVQRYDEWNPRASLVYSTDNVGTLKLLYATATRIPNGFETLSSVSILGNPANRPERIQTIQLQWINNWTSQWRTEVGFFRSEIRNRLETNASITDELRALGFVGQFINLGTHTKQVNNGIDGKIVALLNNAGTVMINATQYFQSSDGHGNPIAYIPNTMINVDYNVKVNNINLNVGMNYRGNFTKAVDDPRPAVKNYLVWRANVVFTPKNHPLEYRVTSRNIFNTKYSYPSSSRDFPEHFPARAFELSFGICYKLL